MSYVIRQEQCPKCAELGKDNSKDNLAVYADGHTHCFGCGYHTFLDKVILFKNKKEPALASQPKVFLPEDFEYSYPDKALKWIEQYELSRNTLVKHGVGWSQEKQYLIFPYYDNHTLFAWQGRYFGNNQDHPKWITHGKIHEKPYVLSSKKPGPIILVEDIVSGIKLSKYHSVLPLFGSFISNRTFKELSYFYDQIIIWLDPDKKKESLQFQKIGLQFCPSVLVVLSDKDPKELKETELEEILARKSIIKSTDKSM